MVAFLLTAACSGSTTSSPPTAASAATTGSVTVSPTTSAIPHIKGLVPEAIAVARDGTLFFSDCLAHRIYSVDASQHVRVLGVGNGGLDNGFAGDGGPASNARFSCPAGLTVDRAGSLYIADHVNNRIRAVDPKGVVTTVAGSGPAGINLGADEGDGGPANRARLSEPIGIAFDQRGDLLIADRDNCAVRSVSPNGIISTIAGTGVSGFSGDGGIATKALLSDPEYIAADRHGDVYFTDQINERIRKIDRGGTISTIAGTGEAGYSGDGGQATAAQLNGPYGLAIDGNGDLFVSDSSGDHVQMIDTVGTITTVAGTGVPGYAGDGGSATAAALNQPAGLAVDAVGDLLIADAGNGVIRMVEPNGIITTVVGN